MISPEFKSEMADRVSRLFTVLTTRGVIKDQKALADVLDTTKQSVSDMLLGKRLPTLEHINIMARELNVNTSWLINGTDPMFLASDDQDEDMIVMITKDIGTGAMDPSKGEKLIEYIRNLQIDNDSKSEEIAKQRNEIIELMRLELGK